MTVLEVLKLASDHFQKRGSDSARLDAEVLLAHTLGLRRLDLYLKFDRPLTDPEVTSYRDLVSKRAKGQPVAYLVGHKEFMGLDFVVTPAVLVPNPDTEVLVQRAVEIAREASAFRAFRTSLRSGFELVNDSHVSIDVLLSWVTTRYRAVATPMDQRGAGASNYTVRKLLRHSLNMVTGYSSRHTTNAHASASPLRRIKITLPPAP